MNTIKLKRFNSRIREGLQEFKMNTGCCVCGYKANYAALAFHHIHPKDKYKEIPKIINGRKYDELLIELNKCTLMCANCHFTFHNSKEDVKESMRIHFKPIDTESFLFYCYKNRAIEPDCKVNKRAEPLEIKIRNTINDIHRRVILR